MKPPHGSKTSFVRSQPPKLPAKQVVALARKQGIKLSVGYVHSVRWMANRPPKRKPGPELSAQPVRDPNAADTKLRQLFGEVGLTRSREIVDSIERAFA